MPKRSDLRYLVLAVFVVLLGLFNSGLDETLASYNPPPPTSALGRPLVKLAYHFRTQTNEERFYHCFGQMALGRQHDYRFLVKHRGDLGEYHEGMVGPETVTGPTLPYRDYIAEYPPVNFPFIAGPSLAGEKLNSYATTFRVTLALLNSLALLFFLRLAIRWDFSPEELRRFLLLSLLGTVLLGPIMVTRLDPITLFFLAAALLAVSSERPLVAGLALALATGAKIVPVFLMPFFFLHWLLNKETRKALQFGLASTAGLALVFLPALLAGPDNFRALFRFHGERPIQVESTFAALLRLQELFLGTPAQAVHSFGSWNLTAASAHLYETASKPLALGTVAVMLVLYWRGLSKAPRLDKTIRERWLLSACGATVSGLMVFSKVFSPQYLIWTWPWFFLINKRKYSAVSIVTLVTLFLTQLVAQPYATAVVKGELAGTLLLGARNLCLLLLLLLMARPPREAAETTPSDSPDWGRKTVLLPFLLALLALGIQVESSRMESRWTRPIPDSNPRFVQMELNATSKGQAVPRRGYSGLESDPRGLTFAWTIEPRVDHYFPPADPNHAYIFEFKGLDSMNPDIMNGTQLTVNGEPVPLWKQGERWPLIYSAWVPSNLLKTDAWNQLTLHTPEPISPKAAGRGQDFRELGIMVDWLSFNMVDGFAAFGSAPPQELLSHLQGWVEVDGPDSRIVYYRPGDFTADFARLPVDSGWSAANAERADRPFRRLEGSGKVTLQVPEGRRQISFTVLKDTWDEETSTVELEVEGAGKIPLNRREEDWETVYQGEFESGGAETTLTFSKSSFFAADPKLGVLTIRKTP